MTQKSQRGFSLTELLVAVAVGAMVMMGIYSVFMNSMTVFQGQQEISQIQFNAKSVISFMREKIANTGSGLQADIPMEPIAFQNNASSVHSGFLTGTDALQVRTFGNIGTLMGISIYNVTGGMPHASAVLNNSSLDGNPADDANASVGNMLVLWQEASSNYALLEISHVDITNALVKSDDESYVELIQPTSLAVYNNHAQVNQSYAGGLAAMIDRNSMDSLTFFVDSTNVLRMSSGGTSGIFNMGDPNDPNNPASLPLLDNVEDFQVELGFDIDNDNIVDNWTFTDAGFNLADLLAVKCYLLVRSPRGDRFTSDVQRPDIDPNDGVSYAGAPDNVRRRLYSFSVQLRNRLN